MSVVLHLLTQDYFHGKKRKNTLWMVISITFALFLG